MSLQASNKSAFNTDSSLENQHSHISTNKIKNNSHLKGFHKRFKFSFDDLKTNKLNHSINNKVNSISEFRIYSKKKNSEDKFMDSSSDIVSDSSSSSSSLKINSSNNSNNITNKKSKLNLNKKNKKSLEEISNTVENLIYKNNKEKKNKRNNNKSNSDNVSNHIDLFNEEEKFCFKHWRYDEHLK